MKKLCIFFIVFIFLFKVNAQEITVIGKVTAFRTIPLKNINVIVKKINAQTKTDENGMYSIKCSLNDVLSFESESFSSVKYKLKEVKDSVNINLYFSDSKRRREIAVAAGHIDKETLENAIATLPNMKEDYSKYANIYELIKVKFPFVQIKNGVFFIPPPQTGNGDVLLICNGISVSDISSVQPRDVKSIKVLRGSEATIYGMRGANGVIEIKTFVGN